MLDQSSIIKASQAIASEIELDKLLSRMVDIILQTSSAQKCIVILTKRVHEHSSHFHSEGGDNNNNNSNSHSTPVISRLANEDTSNSSNSGSPTINSPVNQLMSNSGGSSSSPGSPLMVGSPGSNNVIANLVIQAYKLGNDEETVTLQNITIKEFSEEMCVPLVMYVARVKQYVLLDNASYAGKNHEEKRIE